MQHDEGPTCSIMANDMEQPSITGRTPAGQTYNLAWPGDTHGGGSKPAVPVKKRAEFVADVRGETEDGTKLDTAALRKKWGKLLSSDRTLFKWVAWAKGLAPIVEGAPDA
jgi:hypothetical protein